MPWTTTRLSLVTLRTSLLLFGLLAMIGPMGLLTSAATAQLTPTCTTSVPIAVPDFPSTLNTLGADVDGDGLFDIAEDEVANCAAPIFFFDSGEPALQPNEPVLLHAIYPSQFDGNDELRLIVNYAMLFEHDGGYFNCLFPETDGCNSHVADSQSLQLQFRVTGLYTAEVLAGTDSEGHPASFLSSKLNLFPSWGKHHIYFGTMVCGTSGCDCSQCGLGHYDRADGNGPVRQPTSTNVGQNRSFDVCSYPETHGGYINHLASVGFPGDYVYDPCDEQCPNGGDHCADSDPGWTAFMDDASNISSIHRLVVKDPALMPIHLTEVDGQCVYGPQPLGQDGDGDGIVDVCDDCAGTADPNQVFPPADGDGDGVPNLCDNCPWTANASQWDTDADGIGDMCDNCPNQANPDQADNESDGWGDVCDPDDDNDTCLDTVDEDPLSQWQEDGSWYGPFCNPQSFARIIFAGTDSDGDGLANCQDPNDDNDYLLDGADNCPTDFDFPTIPASCEYFADCPLATWWDICILGGCDELLIKVVSTINPDPTITLGGWQMAYPSIYIPVSGEGGHQQLVQTLTSAPAGGMLRLEVWSQTAAKRDERLLGVLAEYQPAEVEIGDLSQGGWLAVTVGEEGQPLQMAASWLPSAPPGTALRDEDGDGRPDPFDNCLQVPNGPHGAQPALAQRDTDGDGFGNLCDGDLNDDGIVDDVDARISRELLGTDDPDADLDGDGRVDELDLELLESMLGQPPGPSGLRAFSEARR